MAALRFDWIRLCGPALAAALLAIAALPASAGDVTAKLDSGAAFSVTDNTGSIQRLRVDEATGNVSRNGALFVHTTGSNNLFVGPDAGNPTTSGYGFNTAFGRAALHSITTGRRNSAFGFQALYAITAGQGNSAFGRGALQNSTGSFNSAFGESALGLNTTGYQNSAFGESALLHNTSGQENSAFGGGALFNNTAGAYNSAFGGSALSGNSTGFYNSAFGSVALSSNTIGSSNSAFGTSALSSNTSGSSNAAFGRYALRLNVTGGYNSAFGGSALRENQAFSNAAFGYSALRHNSTGGNNSAFGNSALENNTTGSANIAIGIYAGRNQTTGSSNIYLANQGVAGESGRIKIGTVGTHTQATIAGISGATSAGGVAVLVNASGVLGTTTSSARFKQDVRDMGEASDVLMKLRPVTFRYREEVVGAEDAQATQYGLIAEEVAEVAPELVAPDLDGRPYSVKYHELPALLLNELQKTERTVEAQRQEIAALKARLAQIAPRN